MIDLLEAQAACRARHTGLFAMEANELRQAVAAVNLGLAEHRGRYGFLGWERDLVQRGARGEELSDAERQELLVVQAGPEPRRPLFSVDPDSGIAVIEVVGVLGKGRSKLFDVNTVDVRRAVRLAARDPEVRGILLVVDSPGGTVAGTDELARDIRSAAALKPLRVHADDLLASAAVWISAAAERITASPTTEVGSVGTLLVVEDRSAQAEKEGVVVHVISTGAFKGAGVEGSAVTEEHLAFFRERVAALNEHFLQALREGRKLTGTRLEAVSDGRVHIADRAQQLGLIDAVKPLDEAVASFRRSLDQRRASQGRKARVAALGLEAALEKRVDNAGPPR